MKILRSSFVRLAVLLAAGGFASGARAASVGSGGYTNDFASQPPAADWSFLSIAGASGDVTDTTGLDTAVQATTAATINTQVVTDAGNPPAFNASALWSSTGFYLQTRPTGNRATLLMCTLVNNLGSAASSIRIQYNLTSAVSVTEEVPAHLVYYSLTGAANSWIPISSLDVANPTCCYTTNLIANVTLASNWNAGATMYVLFADDNGSGSPDVAYQIDNFSFKATPATPTPIVINSQPADLTVISGQQASFTVAASGFPISYQWYRNVSKITGATSPTFSINAATNGSAGQYFCILTNQVSGNVTSRVATLTVLTDTFPPTILSAVSPLAGTSVRVLYSENVPNAARNTNYIITVSGTTNRLNITGVSATSPSITTIATSPRVPGISYTLSVTNVMDAAGNTIAPNTKIQIATEDNMFVMTNVWRIETNGIDLGSSWRDPAFNDSTWATGAGAFDGKSTGNRLQLAGQPINTFLPLNSPPFPPPNDTPTYYFRTHFNYPGYTNGGILRLTHLVDDSAIFYLNGVEMYRFQYPNVPITFSYNSTVVVGDAAIVGPIDLTVGSLLTGDNVLAVEVHQANANSSDITFGASLVGHSESIPFGPVAITNQPADMTVTESHSVSFQVGLVGVLPYRFQWYTNAGGTSSVFTAVSGATNSVYTIPIAPLGMNGTRIRVAVTNTFTNTVFGAVSSNAVLTVLADKIGPELLSANANATFDSVLVTFSERITSATAMNISNYKITNSAGVLVSITGATLADGTNVTLTLAAPLAQDDRYILRVSGVRDISTLGNTIFPNSGVTIGGSFTFIFIDTSASNPDLNTALWKYNQDNFDLGTDWKNVGFDDSGWSQGYSLLGKVVDPFLLPAELNTSLSTDPPDFDLYSCYYFRKTFVFPGSTNGATLLLRHVVDDGAVFYLNGKEFYRFNMAPGPVTFFSSAFAVGNASIVGPIVVPLTNVVSGTNLLAVELHQQNNTSNDGVFGAELLGSIQSIPLTDFIPRLSVARSNANVRLTWTVAGYTLEQANSVTGTWTTASGVVNGTTNSLLTQTTNSARFFRLRR